MLSFVLLETLALSIKRLQHRNYRVLDTSLAPLGISLVQWGALREIEQNPGYCMHRLAELTFNSDQAFGTLMTRLLRQRLVERQPGAGRIHLHRLTPRGRTLLAEGHKRVRRVLNKTFAPLEAEECAHLQILLDRVLGRDAYPAAVPACPLPASAKFTSPAPVSGRPIVRAGASHLKPASRRASRTR